MTHPTWGDKPPRVAGSLPPMRPDQELQAAVTRAGSGPAPASPVIVARRIIIIGPNGSLLAYQPNVGPGNLVDSIAAVGFTDTAGNVVLAGETSYRAVAGGFEAAQNFGGAVTFYTATTEAGPWTAIGFLQPVGGATTTTMQLGTPVGGATAVGSLSVWYQPGLTDDGAAINALFALGFKTITVLPGTANLASTAITPDTDQELIGFGGATKFTPASTFTDSYLIKLKTPATTSRVTVRDLLIDINYATNPAVSYTATNASPCVFTAPGTAFANGQQIVLKGGVPPAPFVNSQVYFVVSVAGTSFSLAATPGGTAINSTSTGSGAQTLATTIGGISLDNTGWLGSGGQTDSAHYLQNLKVFRSSGDSFHLDNAVRELRMENCIAESGLAYGTYIGDAAGAGNGCTDCHFTDCTMGNNAIGAWEILNGNHKFANCKGFGSGNNRVTGVFAATTYNWHLNGTNGHCNLNTFASCHGQQAGLHNWFLDGCIDSTFAGCDADQAGAGTGASGYGMLISSALRCSVTGLTGSDHTPLPSNQIYGIAIQGTCNGTTIVASPCNGTSGGFTNLGTGAGYFLMPTAQTDATAFTVTAAVATALSHAFTIPANDANAGTWYRLTVEGFGTEGTTAQNLALSIGINGVSQRAGTLAALTISGVLRWKAVIDVHVATTGAGGTCELHLSAGWATNATPAVEGSVESGTGSAGGDALNTTVANTVQLMAAWASTTGAPTVTSTASLFERLGP